MPFGESLACASADVNRRVPCVGHAHIDELTTERRLFAVGAEHKQADRWSFVNHICDLEVAAAMHDWELVVFDLVCAVIEVARCCCRDSCNYGRCIGLVGC